MTPEISPEKLAWLEALSLAHGSHDATAKAACVMEAVAYVAGEPWSDAPKCASKVITRFCVRLNDRWGDRRRQALKPYVLRIAGTAASDEIERRRAFMCADWAVREALPIALEAARIKDWPEKLRALPEAVDKKSAERARDVAREAGCAAAAADAYAADAYAAAAYAAAADAAAADAAADAADAADAARAKADASALALLDRLIRVTEVA